MILRRGTFGAYDGTTLAYRLVGEGEPLVRLPGGAMRASTCLGDLGALSAHRQLVLLDLRGTGDSAVPADPATYRCERLVADAEALREHLGLERMDLPAHSAAGNPAMLYAAADPGRIRRLALVTPTAWTAGVPLTGEARLRGVDAPGSVRPFLYGRWDAAARAHAAASPLQLNEAAATSITSPALLIAGGPTSHIPQDRPARTAELIPGCY